jgi:N utilization substance protein B
MAGLRDIRRLAFQALYQIDQHDGRDMPVVRASLDESDGYTPSERDTAFATAQAAYQHRAAADKELAMLAPNWPAHRQAAVDRAILRLAHYEVTLSLTSPSAPPPKAVVNDAVELAKEFSTDKSPSFINGVLDKVLKRVLSAMPPSAAGSAPKPAPEA